MSNHQLQSLDTGKARLTGELTFDSVPRLADAVDALLDAAPELELDLSEVSRSDSAGLALLISWERKARAKGKRIVFAHLPGQLLGMARLSGVEEILMPLAPV